LEGVEEDSGPNDAGERPVDYQPVERVTVEERENTGAFATTGIGGSVRSFLQRSGGLENAGCRARADCLQYLHMFMNFVQSNNNSID